MKRLRFLGSHLGRRQRRVYGAVALFYLLAVLGTTWPVYEYFGTARPLILGMPLSLFYVASWAVASFFVLLALFRWEARTTPEDREDEPGSVNKGSAG